MNTRPQALLAADAAAERLSALCDGALTDADLNALMAEPGLEASVCERWHAYQVIGAALRGDEPLVAACASGDFLAGVRARLAADAAAAPVLAPAPVGLIAPAGAAANDGVFRWKLVAGFASVAAVAAVGWNVWLTTPDASSPAGQLAQTQTPAPATAPVLAGSAAPAAPASGQTLLVETRQGKLIRDAGLERLLAEHRQHGGMSALQNPTGFIRNATYDADAR